MRLAGRPPVPRIVRDIRGRSSREVAAGGDAFRRLERRMERRDLPAPGEARQVVAQEVDAVDRVDARELFHQIRVFGGEEFSLARLPPFVAMRKVERRLSAAGIEEKVRVRAFDTAEVVELVRLPEAHVSHGGRSSLHEREGAPTERVVDFLAPGAELFGRKVLGEEGNVLRRGGAGPKREAARREIRDSHGSVTPFAGMRRAERSMTAPALMTA